MNPIAAVGTKLPLAFIIDSLGSGEVLVLLFLAMIIVGPERLPHTARKIGHGIAHARKMIRDLTGGVQDVIDDPAMAPLRELGELAVRPKQKLSEFIRDAERNLESDGSDETFDDKPMSPGGPTDVSLRPRRNDRPERSSTDGHPNGDVDSGGESVVGEDPRNDSGADAMSTLAGTTESDPQQTPEPQNGAASPAAAPSDTEPDGDDGS